MRGKDLQVGGDAGAAGGVVAGDGQEGWDRRSGGGVESVEMEQMWGNPGVYFCIIIGHKMQGFLANK